MLKVLRILVYFIMIILVVSQIMLALVGYDEFCIFIVNFIGKPEKLGVLKAEYFKESNFVLFKIFFIFLIFFSIIFLFSLIKYLDRIKLGVKNAIFKCFSIFTYLKRLERNDLLFLLIIFGLFFTYKLYNLILYPISYDEAVTFLNFTLNGPFVSLSYYPAPNNHIFYSLITNLFYFITSNSFIALRLPSLLIFCVSFFVFFIILHKLFDFKVALISVSLFSILYPVLLYSSQGRGYMLYIFFTIIGTYSSYRIIYEYSNKKYFILWVISMVGGLFVIPSFLYVFVLFCLWITFVLLYEKEYELFYSFFISCILVTIITTLLYLPTIIVSGFGALFSNKYVAMQNRGDILKSLFGLINNYYNYFFYSSFAHIGMFIITFLIISMGYLSLRKKIKRLYLKILIILFILSPIIIIPLHGVIPFARNWSYLSVFITLAFAFILSHVFIYVKLKSFIAFIIAFIISIYGISQFSYRYAEEFKQDYFADNLASYLMNKKFTKFYFNTEYEEVITCYNYKAKRLEYNVDRGHVNSPFALEKDYDAIILSEDTLKSINNQYYLSMKNDYYSLYVKQDSSYLKSIIK